MFVYREPSDPVPASPARQPAEDDPSYWYDLLAEDPAPKLEETRGPFEPLVSSAGPSADAGGLAETGEEPPEQARERKLEQLKDLYLTAEAIGEQNVDKHFDQLLAQQRQLISEYFSQSGAVRPAAEPPGTDAPAGQAGAPDGAGVAEPPRAW